MVHSLSYFKTGARFEKLILLHKLKLFLQLALSPMIKHTHTNKKHLIY